MGPIERRLLVVTCWLRGPAMTLTELSSTIPIFDRGEHRRFLTLAKRSGSETRPSLTGRDDSATWARSVVPRDARIAHSAVIAGRPDQCPVTGALPPSPRTEGGQEHAERMLAEWVQIRGQASSIPLSASGSRMQMRR